METRILRDSLAILIVSTVIIGIIILAIVAINYSKQFDEIKDIFTLLLPVFGTWIGAVIAFYFSEKNLDAANKNVNSLVQTVVSMTQKLEQLLAKDVMHQFPNVTNQKIKDETEFKALKIIDLIRFMERSGTERLPFLIASSGKFHFLLYRTTLERFLVYVQLNKNVKILRPETKEEKSLEELTIEDMYSQKDFKLFQDIIDLTADKTKFFISVNSKLSDAQKLMANKETCQDVFVTETGSPDEPLIGWITDTILAEKADLFRNARTLYESREKENFRG